MCATLKRERAYNEPIDLLVDVLESPTDTIGEFSQPPKMLYGLQNASRMIIFGGGIPLKIGEQIVGAIGVSGGSVDEDMQCAKAGMAAWGAM